MSSKLRTFFSWQMFLFLTGIGMGLSPAIAALPQQETTVKPGFELAQVNLPGTDRGSPDSTAGGGKRGGCISREVKTLFRPVLPISASGEAIANTISQSPRLLWYLPENEAIRAEVSVFAQNNDSDSLVHYQVINDVSNLSGLVEIKLPDNALKVGNAYWVDMTLACNEIDRSADVYLFGSIMRQNIGQLTLSDDPAVLDSLLATLMGENSYLSLSPAETQELITALQGTRDAATVKMVGDRLRSHFVALQNDYAKINQTITKLQQNSSINQAELQTTKMQQRQLALELAQLSAHFGLWSDVVSLLADYRTEEPEAWESLLQALFPADDPLTEEQEDLIIEKLSMN